MRKITFLICMLLSTVVFAAQIKVYTTADCPYCHSLIKQLKAKHIAFKEIPGGKKYDSFPATEVNGQVVYGDNIQEILKLSK